MQQDRAAGPRATRAALTWFAPVQPLLAGAGLALTAAALLVRLRGQVACPLPAAVARG
ncbi:hypothetical protein [Georgenia sp. SUBG003]|uniref:hypothetical protein n=1 Tax=Georgenia sp. SUBG003 TaxID=1497974 RepID=UPI000A6E0D6B